MRDVKIEVRNMIHNNKTDKRLGVQTEIQNIRLVVTEVGKLKMELAQVSIQLAHVSSKQKD